MPPPDAEANPTHVMEPGGKANLNRSNLREILFHSGSLTHPEMVIPLDKAPFYAALITPGIHHTMGGVTINTKAEVQSKAGKSIPGLFAAGEVTGGVHGANRIGGNAVADIVTFGRIAGTNASAYAKAH